ncbi:MAG: hypothetical protein WA941_21445 [Nitrososphaeraceae archaeon]
MADYRKPLCIAFIVLAILILLLGGYFGLWQFTELVPYILATLIGGIPTAILFIFNSSNKTKKITQDASNNKRSRSIFDFLSRRKKFQIDQKPEFEAEIIDKRPAYVRGRDNVFFRSRLTNGYFEYKISAKIPAGVHTYTAYRFRPGTPHVEPSYRYVVLNHPKTMTAWSNGIRGKLNGDVDTGWLSMSWKIPGDVRLGTYVIELMVVDNYDRYTPSYQTIARTFNIIDPDSSHHNRFEGVSVGD